VTHDTDYFRRRAAEARAAASSKVAGELALAYAALARRRPKAAAHDPEPQVEETPAIPLVL
jgi:hypothetical protein